MSTQLEKIMRAENRAEPREGNPIGTYFVASILMVLVVLVGMYFIIANMNDEGRTSPVIAEGTADANNPTLQ